MAGIESPAIVNATGSNESCEPDEDGQQTAEAPADGADGADRAKDRDDVEMAPDFAPADYFGWPRVGGPQAVPKRDLPAEFPCPAVRVEFSAAAPLGLIIDWSMPLPVVAGTEAGTQAALHPDISPGLVLIQVGSSPIQVGAHREQVDLLLQETRQEGGLVEMLFEIAGVRRPPSAEGLLELRESNRLLASPSSSASILSNVSRTLSAPLLGTTALCSDTEKRPFADLRATEFKAPFDDARYGSLDCDRLDRPEALYLVPRGRAAPRPGLRFRDLRAQCAVLQPGTTSLPPIGSDGSTSLARRPSGSLERFDFGSATSWSRPGHAPRASSSVSKPESPAHLRAATTQAPAPGRSIRAPAVGARILLETKSLSWMAAGLAVPDACYSHIVAHPDVHGPGPSARWPLHHADGFICRLSDLERTERIRDAYGVGFKGRKRDGRYSPGPLEPHERTGSRAVEYRLPRSSFQASAARSSTRAAAVFLRERTARIEDVPILARLRRPGGIACDACGQALVPNGKAGWFYFCRSCKSHGIRYELCAACHACEILQGEGKHVGPEIHPHFLRCQHATVAKRSSMEEAWANREHIFRIFCDLCGHLAGTSRRLGGQSEPNSVFTCTRCPAVHGVRFELCTTCAGDFRTLPDTPAAVCTRPSRPQKSNASQLFCERLGQFREARPT